MVRLKGFSVLWCGFNERIFSLILVMPDWFLLYPEHSSTPVGQEVTLYYMSTHSPVILRLMMCFFLSSWTEVTTHLSDTACPHSLSEELFCVKGSTTTDAWRPETSHAAQALWSMSPNDTHSMSTQLTLSTAIVSEQKMEDTHTHTHSESEWYQLWLTFCLWSFSGEWKRGGKYVNETNLGHFWEKAAKRNQIVVYFS